MTKTYTTVTKEINNLWLQDLRKISLKQAREKEIVQPQKLESEKILQRSWHQMILQGWKHLFSLPLLPSKDMRTGLRENPSGATSAQVSEAKERPDIFFEISQEGIHDTELSQDSQEGTDIRFKSLATKHYGAWEAPSEDFETEKINAAQEKMESQENDMATLSKQSIDELEHPQLARSNSHIKSGAQIRERRECEVHPSSPMRKRPWSQFFLKGWSLLFDHSTNQAKESILGWQECSREDPSLKQQKVSSGEVPNKHKEILKLRQLKYKFCNNVKLCSIFLNYYFLNETLRMLFFKKIFFANGKI